MPDLDAIKTHFSRRSWVNFLIDFYLCGMSFVICFTIFLALGWGAAFALYQDGRGLPGLFFACEDITPGWYYFHVLLCSPLMLGAKMVGLMPTEKQK